MQLMNNLLYNTITNFFDKNENYGGTLYLEKGERFPATQHEGSYYTMSKDCSK